MIRTVLLISMTLFLYGASTCQTMNSPNGSFDPSSSTRPPEGTQIPVVGGDTVVGQIEQANKQLRGEPDCDCDDPTLSADSPGERLVQVASQIFEQCAPTVNYGFRVDGSIGRPFIREGSVRIGRTIDCSGLLSAVFATAGAPVFPGRRSVAAEYSFTTRTIRDSECLDTVTLDSMAPSYGLKPGDLINHTGNPGHVVMIAEVGPDPFGLNLPESQRGSCSNLNAENFQIKVFESARALQGPGFRPVNETRQALPNALIRLATQLCRQREGQPVSAGSTIQRHAGSRLPNCELRDPKEIECPS